MSRLIIASVASGLPMGPEVYQEQVSTRASSALHAGTGEEWRVDRMLVRSLRSPLPGTRRLPMGWLPEASPTARRTLGRLLYPGKAVVHRMNLELPPHPHADVVTLHDVISWRFPDETRPVRAAAEELRRAAAVICVSEFTAGEAVELLGIEPPHVIPNGVDETFLDAEPLAHEALQGLGLRRPYVLTSGGASRRKNLTALAEAWPRIRQDRPDLDLALTGPEHPRRTELFADLPGVHLLGRVDDALMPGLMAAAEAVVVPSLYEGFGLPALEAMAVGTPVVAARTSSLPEVVGDGGTLVEPTPDRLVEGILHATSGATDIVEAARRGRLRAAGFTWERSVAAHAKVWASLAR